MVITFRYEGDKLVCPKVVVASPIAAYENTVEVQSLEQLEDIISDPDEMRMQALLVRERILGPAHPDTSYYIRYRGAVYADMGHFERCITLWMYALDMQQKMLEPLSLMTQSSLLRYHFRTNLSKHVFPAFGQTEIWAFLVFGLFHLSLPRKVHQSP